MKIGHHPSDESRQGNGGSVTNTDLRFFVPCRGIARFGKQGIRLYKCYFALQNACWAVTKTHLFCIVPMQAAHLFQTLLRRRHFLRRQDLKQSPSFPAAFPASPSPLPESGGALRMNTTCGRRCAALCGRQYDAALRRPDLLHQFEHQLLAVPFLCVCQTTLI